MSMEKISDFLFVELAAAELRDEGLLDGDEDEHDSGTGEDMVVFCVVSYWKGGDRRSWHSLLDDDIKPVCPGHEDCLTRDRNDGGRGRGSSIFARSTIKDAFSLIGLQEPGHPLSFCDRLKEIS